MTVYLQMKKGNKRNCPEMPIPTCTQAMNYIEELRWFVEGQLNICSAWCPAKCRTLCRHSEACLSETLIPYLQCMVSSQVPYTLQAFWGVSIRELHLFLWQSWSVVKNHVHEGTLLRGHYQHRGISTSKGPHGDKLLTVFLPQQALDLGTPPRLCYPLVIFLVRNDQGSTHPDETVALINVIHIKDLVCTLPTSILAQYLKQANGQLSCLKQLYLATGLSYDDESNTTAVPQLSQDEQLCVVCQYFPLSRALLPCRHTCICASCFVKVDRCPMCRSPIRSYFCVRGEDYMPGEPAGTSNKKPTPLMQVGKKLCI
uniref:RING-type domain-containing protein n=1 Tax=Timema genevievae TaxID=629358 RepID=A0A7R9K737_TIMGE|nr:unnamed protein product [Timema genevievae]